MKLRNILTVLLAVCLLLSIALPAFAAPEFSPGVVAVGTGKVSGTLTVRGGPGTDWAKVGTLKNGDRVEIYEIKTVSGAKWGFLGNGWIKMSYVVLDKNQPQSSPIVGSGEIDGLLWWKFCQDGTLYITGRVTFDGTSVEPSRYGWYKYRNRITSVVFYGETPYVPACAFSSYPVISDEYPKLKQVTLCDSVKEIRSGAFANCTALESINIPASLKEIRGSAFNGCTSLKTVDLEGSSLETIGEYAFSGSAITSVSLPKSLRTIDQGAFKGCADLETLTLRDGIITIGHFAFEDCPALTGELYLPETIEYMEITSFDPHPGFSKVTINSNYAQCIDFEDSQTLESVTFGGNVLSIYGSRFENCTNLKEVNLSVPIKFIYNYTFAGCTSLKEITLPDTLEDINPMAFQNCGITSVAIPASVENIDWRAFENCVDLKEITFLGSVPLIDNAAFNGVTATVSYPLDDPSWTEEVMKNYGGTLTWNTGKEDEEEPASNIGDVNGDSKVNGLDAILLRQHIAGWDVTIDAHTADVNGDGKVNGLDMIRLRQYLAGWDVSLGK